MNILSEKRDQKRAEEPQAADSTHLKDRNQRNLREELEQRVRSVPTSVANDELVVGDLGTFEAVADLVEFLLGEALLLLRGGRLLGTADPWLGRDVVT